MEPNIIKTNQKVKEAWGTKYGHYLLNKEERGAEA